MAVFGVEFTSNGSAKVESEINAILRGAKATSSEIVALSKTLNTSAQSASAFAAKLGLSTGAANEVVNKFKALRQSGLDNANTFRLLQNETGITAAQYKNLVVTLKDADAQSARYNQRLKDQAKAQEATKEASDAQLIALQEVNRAAQQVARALNAFTGQAVGAFIEYEDALTTLRAKANPTAEQMKDLEAAILDVALVTSQTPASAAKAATSFISLGAGADGAAENLKTAAQLTDAFRGDFTVAAKVVQLGATIFSDFGETAQSVGDKISYISDTSAVGSSTGLQEFLQLFSKSAPLAKTLGINLDELIASFAVLRDAGQAPEVAATSLKSLLSTIIDNKQKFSELGVEVFDANGKFVGLAETFKRIAQAGPSASAGVKLTNSELAELATQANLSGLSIEQVNDIFGKIGVSSALTLAGSYEVVAQKTEAVGDQMGTLAEKSAIINSSIQGQINRLTGSFESALVDIGKSLSRVTGPAVAGMLELINVFLAAPPVVKDFVGVTIGVTTAAVGVVAALTGYGLALKALETAKVRTTLKTIAATAANTANAISAVAAGVANQGLAKSLKIVAVASINAAEGITAAAVSAGKTALAFAPLLLALGGVVASAKLVQASIDSSTSANRAKSGFDALNKSLEDYRKATGQVVPEVEKTKSRFDELKDGLKDLGSELAFRAENLKAFGIGTSAAESGANSLTIATADLQPTLNALNSEFLRFKQSGELGSDAAKKLIPSLEAAKNAIALLQAEGVRNVNVGADQLLVWQQQQSDLTDLINEIKGAATATIKLNEETEESIKTYEELANALANTMGAIETDLLNAQRDAYAEFGDNKEALDQRLFELDQASLERRLAAQQKFLADINTATFESEDEKQSKILEAKQSVAELELEINKKSSDRLLEQQEEARKAQEEAEKEARKAQEEAEKEAIERRSALRQAKLDKDLRNIEMVKKAAELAAQARIDAENQVLEALDDQSTAISNQLALLDVWSQRQELISSRRVSQVDDEIQSLQKVKELLDRLNDSETSINEKKLIREKLQRDGIGLATTERVINEAIRQKESERRDEEFKALLIKQDQEQLRLKLTQEQERIDLRRQLAQAEIAKIEAELLIIQTQLAMKAQERLIYSKEQELIAKRSEGAPQSELIALQGQIDAERDNLKLKQSELPLAQRSLDLANDGIADAQRAQEESENLFGQQQANLNLQQEIDREQALQFDREEDENDRFERSQEGVTQRDVQRARSLTGRRNGVSAGETRRSTPIAEQMDVSAFKLIDSLDALTNVIEENGSNAIGVPTVDGSVDSPIPRALGGPVSPGQSYIVGERRPELFVPRVPGTIVPRVPQMNGFSANLSKVESLLTQLANRPVPTVNAPTTFINQPNPLQTQIELLQGQLRVARGSL